MKAEELFNKIIQAYLDSCGDKKEGIKVLQQYVFEVSREKILKNALHEFLNYRSDISPMECSVQEKLENDWECWLMGDLEI